MRVIECEQGSPEWHAARCGKITASRISDVLAKLKGGGEAKTRSDYRMELVAERLTGVPEEQYVNGYMRWGTEQEPFARAAYENLFDVLVDRLGFVLHPIMDFSGASPDSLVGEDGMIEIKCPKTTTHLRWMQKNVVPPEHVDQCDWELVCGEREWIDFCSYDPRLPEDLQLFVVRRYRDEGRFGEMQDEVQAFNGGIESAIEGFRHGR